MYGATVYGDDAACQHNISIEGAREMFDSGGQPHATNQHLEQRNTPVKLPFGGRNVLIHGDNDRALDALTEEIKGSVQCIYIDPPYNNLESYAHYEDRDDHEVWIDKMLAHVGRLKATLTESGSIWISIDDRQVHYLKVALDTVFGRENFVTTIIWEHRRTRENRKVFSNNHEYILVYARDYKAFKISRNKLAGGDELKARYKNPDNDPRGPWQSISLNVQAGHATSSQFYDVVAPNGRRHSLPPGRCWAYTKERMDHEIAQGRVWFGKSGNGVPRKKKYLVEADISLTPHTLWSADDVGTTHSAKKAVLKLFPGEDVFETPKPEELLQRIVEIASNPGDLVMDTFLGSGTTGSVALKLGRRFLGVESGRHAVSHCFVRLNRAALDARGDERMDSQVEFLHLNPKSGALKKKKISKA